MNKELIHLKELFTLRFSLLDKAIEKQAIEYERRLRDLNHEAEQLQSMQTKYVSAETYDSRHRELERDIALLKEYRASMESRIATQVRFFSIATIIVSLSVSIGLHFI